MLVKHSPSAQTQDHCEAIYQIKGQIPVCQHGEGQAPYENGRGYGGHQVGWRLREWRMQVRRQSAAHEALQVQLCCLLARECAAGNLAVSPGWVRTSLLDALKVTLLSVAPCNRNLQTLLES